MGCGWGREHVEGVENAAIRVREEVAVEVERDADRRVPYLGMANRRQRRKTDKERRHAPRLARVQPSEPVERLVYSREQAAQAIGISLATLDRRVIPVIATIKTEVGRATDSGRRARALPRRAHRGATSATSTTDACRP
jgi:hypothetical protein